VAKGGALRDFAYTILFERETGLHCQIMFSDAWSSLSAVVEMFASC